MPNRFIKTSDSFNAEFALDMLIQFAPASIAVFDADMRYLMVTQRWLDDNNLKNSDIIGKFHYEIVPEIPQRWRDIHQACLAGETLSHDRDPFVRADGTTDYIKWEVKPWYLDSGGIGGIIMFTEIVTHLVKVEDALRDRVHVQNMLIENLPEISVFLFDTDMRYIIVDGAPLRKAGYDPTQMVGKRLQEAVPPESFKRVYQHYHRVLQGETFVFERRNEQLKSIYRNYATPIKNDNNEVIAGLIVSQEVTEHERLQESVKQSDARFAGIVRLAADAVISINEAQEITLFNPAAELMFGYTEEEALGQPLDILLPDQFVELHKRHVESFHYGSPSKYMGERKQLYGKRRDGSEFPLEASISRLEIDGSFVFTVMVHDITERIERSEKLRVTQARFKAIFNNTFQFTGFMNVDGTLLEANQAALEFGGLTEAEVIGKPFWETYWWTVSEATQKRLQDAIKEAAKGKFVRYDEDVISKYGDMITIDFSIKPMFDPDGKVIQLIPEGRDITEMINIRRELARSNEELQNFAYVASHDLQEPLRMITSFMSLLQVEYQDQLDEEANQYIRFATDGASRMKSLISDLLLYSRVTTQGQLPQHVDMNQVAQKVHDNLLLVINESGATIRQNQLPIVTADEVQMVQLLQNLIANAIKFRHTSRAPHVQIEVQDADKMWQFSVKDNGIGISDKFKERIFVIFQRLHTRQEYEGNGIGLAVCMKIVQRHGGTMWVESAPNEGSTFYFTIPKA